MSWKHTVDEVCRRALDVTAAGVGLAFLSPLFALLSLVIKLDSPGLIFFRGERVGKNGKHFHVYKFRTMVAGAAQKGPGITSAGDSRVTRVGRFMRRTKLDELPQLINVLKGDMSLVGPRPEDPRYVAIYTPEQRQVLSVRPGITSLASLRFRHEEELLEGDDWERVYREKILPTKLEIDLDYLEHRSVWRDMRIIAQTLMALVRWSC
jgi:lipopolysaccharide/colanic/teichoic acid biosynthesis glycosyltransferase